MSLSQIDVIVGGLLDTASGGRFPVLLVIAQLQSIIERFSLPWKLVWQGINVADSAAGASGDIEVQEGSEKLLVAEVTERRVDRDRVVATFNTKIVVSGIREYLFFTKAKPPEDAVQQAYQYFAQGHEINFVPVQEWIRYSLAIMGAAGRTTFLSHFVDLLESSDIPSGMKVAWNEQVERLMSRGVTGDSSE